jgi:uncharacterized phage protein (TIGR02218 family)
MAASPLRSASGALITALAGGVPLWRASIFTFTLIDGVTVYNWTSWDTDLVVSGTTYSSKAPWLTRTTWSVANTMEVPSMTIKLRALNGAFGGGAQIKTQIHNGLFDGATVSVSDAFMSAPGVTSTLGTIALFTGKVAGIDLNGTTATLTVKGKVNDLDQYAPRTLYQIGCNHAFCDAGCTLLKATYTASFAVGSGSGGPTASFIPWASAPGAPSLYQNGEVTMTSGAASGQSRTVAYADATGLTLTYPLYQTPAAADTFSALQGCDKTFASGSGRSCTDRANTQHYKGYEFVPPPNSAY